MADAALRARLEAAQARHRALAAEAGRDLPPSPSHQRAVAERDALAVSVASLEAKLAEAVRREDELLEDKARGGGVVQAAMSAIITMVAALPGIGLVSAAALLHDLDAPLALAGAAVLLPLPLLVNGLRLRRGRRRAERSRRVRAGAQLPESTARVT